MAEVIGVIVRRDKAHIPVNAKIEGGGYLQVPPVFTADLTTSALVEALEHAIAVGHPQIPSPTNEEMRRRQDPILAATRAKSWGHLAKDGVSYTIAWRQDQIILYVSRLDKNGRFENDPDKTQIFPKDTLISTIAEAILADTKARPELGNAQK